ncbi:MAG TPA: LysR family transcriptional regulator [Blastocatellia bacterium]|jgi:DNA-binding transcriptional LysR family regulator|nr:LysR family transcriptional regulator [Blastocatellia bacterium]
MNLKSFDLNLLLIFEALMEERNVTRAARRVGLSQPAMSNALTRLRRTFNDPLLVRTPAGMAPTPAAQGMIAAVRAALSQLRAVIEEKPAFDPSASRRTFHLLANDYAEILLLAPMLGTLRVRAGGINLRIQRPASLFQAPTPAQLADSANLAVGFFPDALTLDAALHFELLWEERNVCIASAAHPSIRGRISMRQYAAAHHVAVFYKTEGPGIIDTLLAQKGLARHSTVLVPHFASVPFLVSDSDLIATVPERLALKFSKLAKLQVLPVPITIPPFRLTMVWHERVHADPAHSWLRNLIAEIAAEQNGE